jgi:diacylglycerol kinase
VAFVVSLCPLEQTNKMSADLPSDEAPHPRSWYEKFRDAFRGVRSGMRGQSSFRVHILVALAVIVAAALLRCNLWQWCILSLCIAGVLTAEMFNSALEHFAKAVDKNPDPHLRDALDTSSAAVLFASLAAAVVGAMIFISRVVELFTR